MTIHEFEHDPIDPEDNFFYCEQFHIHKGNVLPVVL